VTCLHLYGMASLYMVTATRVSGKGGGVLALQILLPITCLDQLLAVTRITSCRVSEILVRQLLSWPEFVDVQFSKRS